MEALGRRIGALLWSMYVDDGSLQEAAAAMGAGQLLIRKLFGDVGVAFKDEKRLLMACKQVFGHLS